VSPFEGADRSAPSKIAGADVRRLQLKIGSKAGLITSDPDIQNGKLTTEYAEDTKN
jgi:hypothetical protein